MRGPRTDIAARFGSVHRFCRLHPALNRATVSMILAGKYCDKRQARRIREALEERDGERRIMVTIKATACARCGRCDDLSTAMARAVTQLFSR